MTFIEDNISYQRRMLEQQRRLDAENAQRQMNRLHPIDEIILDFVKEVDGVPVRDVGIANEAVKRMLVHGRAERNKYKIIVLSKSFFSAAIMIQTDETGMVRVKAKIDAHWIMHHTSARFHEVPHADDIRRNTAAGIATAAAITARTTVYLRAGRNILNV